MPIKVGNLVSKKLLPEENTVVTEDAEMKESQSASTIREEDAVGEEKSEEVEDVDGSSAGGYSDDESSSDESAI